MKLIIATCQFPVDGDVARNLRFIEHQMREARRHRAHIAHFCEASLSGYAGIEVVSFKGFDWESLAAATRRVMALARQLRLWVVLGSSHRLCAGHKPHNSLYLIDDRGRLRDRYDKMFCTGDSREASDDLRHYSPGDHFVTFKIRGIVCGLQICHDFRYQELYREYKRRGAQVVFHSYHNGHSSRAAIARRRNIWGVMVQATMQTYAANNHLSISATNTSRRHSSWPGFFVRPDGIVTGRLKLHRSGVLISTVDSRAKFYDASVSWRDRAMRGVYHSGTPVSDLRSRNRTLL